MAEDESRYPDPREPDDDSELFAEPAPSTREQDVFNLISPCPLEDGESETPDELVTTMGRNVHTIGITDRARLSIDNEGRLYWDWSCRMGWMAATVDAGGFAFALSHARATAGRSVLTLQGKACARVDHTTGERPPSTLVAVPVM